MSRLMAAGHAAIAAATLYSGTGNFEAFKQAFPLMLQGILNNGGDPGQAAPAPGPAPAGNPAIAQAQQNLAQGGVAATPEVSFANDEARWRDALIDNPDNWYNNMGDPKATNAGGRGADFRHKKNSDEVVFLNGKYGPAPQWVFERLGVPFPGQVPAQQQIPTAGAPF